MWTKEQMKEYLREWRHAHKEESKAYTKAWHETHKEQEKLWSCIYQKNDLNSFGKTKNSIRSKSLRYLQKYGKKIPNYEIHHCCTYDEPYKFIYCSKETHLKIHRFLYDNNINSNSDHYQYIKHLLDDTVVKYGID